VSHALKTVERMCDHAIYLKEGSISLNGPVLEVTTAFAKEMNVPN
jgi:ABC-type polysaccharide/polyol phosphate transport system ATPase subunit